MYKDLLDEQGHLIIPKYYVYKYGLLPSFLRMPLKITPSADNMNILMNIIGEMFDYEILLEIWEISSSKNQDSNKDYIDFYILNIEKYKICIKIAKKYDSFLYVNYWYDQKSRFSLEMVKESMTKIRDKLSQGSGSTLEILSRHGPYFDTEHLYLSDNLKLDIGTNYNDDFQEVDHTIQEALSNNNSGLILLHGIPGTGKTTYIKHLIGIHPDQEFIFVPNEFVQELIQPSFVSFLLTKMNAILIIEDAEKIILSRDIGHNDSVVSTILQLTDGLLSDYLNIKVICTFNTSLHNIDQALLRKGRLLAFYEFGKLSLVKTNHLLKSLNQETSNTEMTLADIYYNEKKGFTNEKKSIGFG